MSRHRLSPALLALLLALLMAPMGCRPAATPGTPRPAAPIATRPAATATSVGDTSAASARFTDITRQAGVEFTQYHGGCGQRFFVEQIAAGAALLDANGDGRLDIYFPQPQPLGACASRFKEPLHQRLYLNQGSGRFTLATGAFGGKDTDYAIAAAVGDYDNDGRPDLYVACYGKNTLYHNRGDGTFEDVTARAGVGLKGFSSGAVWFDADRDGRLDLYVLRYCEWSLDKDITCRGPRGEPDVCQPTTYTAATNVFYHNNGDGTFTEATARAGFGSERRRSLSAAAADFDGDGKIDLFVANDLGPNYLFRNKGNGTFEEIGMEMGVAFGATGNAQANMGLAVGDYDGDGDLDVAVSTFQNEPFAFFRNQGTYFTDAGGETGIAEATIPYLGFGDGFFDARNLGRLDLFFANGHVSPFGRAVDGRSTWKQSNLLLLNDGRGRFTSAPTALPTDDVRVHRGACFGDIDNDGRLDVLVTASDDRPTLLHNESPPHNWLQLKLIDRYGCGTPVGPRCTAEIGGARLVRVALGGGSYGGSSDSRIHFGLGNADHVDRLEIRWTSGKVQTLTDVKANQILDVRER